MRRTFNIGIGFCLLVDPGAIEDVLTLAAIHEPAVIGRLTTGDGVELI